MKRDEWVTPTVDPIGIVRYPKGYAAAPRRYSAGLRGLASLLLIVFAVVVTVTTGVSLGRYCLTSDGGDTAALAPWLGVPSAPNPDPR